MIVRCLAIAMKKTKRLDKILCEMGVGTRSELKNIIKSGNVSIDGHLIKQSGMHVDPYTTNIIVNGVPIHYRDMIYVMLHKPPNVISATKDTKQKTVLDLLPSSLRLFRPFPVGRLDKDTEGLLLLTNDGSLSHRLLSPNKHVPKTYEAVIMGDIGSCEVERFHLGVTLDDGYVTLPSKLKILQRPHLRAGTCYVSITIYEGKFHQIKRMFQALDKKVLYLKRVAMGPLTLDPTLPIGHCRELTSCEVKLVCT